MSSQAPDDCQRGLTVMGNHSGKLISWIIIFNFLKGWLCDFTTLHHLPDLGADLAEETPHAVKWKVGHVSQLGGKVALSWCPLEGWGFRPKRGLHVPWAGSARAISLGI